MPDYDPPPDYTIRVPVAGEWLNANRRRQMHWTKDRDLTAAWRQATGWMARKAKVPALGQSHVIAELHMVPRRRTRIDPANYAPTAKAAVDGLVDAGIWPDDSSGWVIGPDMRLGEPVKTQAREALVLLIWGRQCCAHAGCHHDEQSRDAGPGVGGFGPSAATQAGRGGTDVERARAMDDRPPDKLHTIAADVAAERFGSIAELESERRPAVDRVQRPTFHRPQPVDALTSEDLRIIAKNHSPSTGKPTTLDDVVHMLATTRPQGQLLRSDLRKHTGVTQPRGQA